MTEQITLIENREKPSNKESTMETLTELNALFTYQERCKNAAKHYTSHKESNESQAFASQEFWARIIASSWQVEIVDMLAETNNQ